MTDFPFHRVAVYDQLGGVVRLARNSRIDVKDPATGLVAAGLKVSGVSVPFVTTDAHGQADWTSTLGTVDITSPNGLTERVSSHVAVEAAVGAGISSDSAVAALLANPASATRVAGDGVYPKKTVLPVNVKDYGATGDGTTDDRAAIQAAFNATPARGTVYFPPGDYKVASQLTLSTTDVTVDLGRASITSTLTTTSLFAVSASGVTIQGGSITGPASWDGTNVQPTYAMIHATAAGLKVRDLSLTNIRKVGIYADDTDDLTVIGCKITGNYPAGSYTGTETGHFGIAVNPGTSGRSGRTIISGNLIQSCVQGAFFGNYGATATGAYGAVVVNNVFDGCHNHGVYNAGGVDAVTVTGNAFARCSLPIALTGTAHSISGNVMMTHGTGNNLDLVGISLREAVDCSVVGNTIKGDAPAASVVIDVANFTGTSVRGNVVEGNVIDVTSGTATGIRVGRAGQTTDCSDNVVANNTIRSVGNAGVGLITVASTTAGFGNKVTGNNLVIKGESHGIYVTVVSHTTVQNNSIRFEYDAGSAKTLGAVVMNATTYCTVSLNDVHNPSTYGTNVALRGVWEQGASSKNRIIQNGYHGDLTKLTSFTPIVLITNSDAYLDERGIGSPTGAFFGAPGSRWSREDGGASTSLYVKETANTSATWRAV